MATYRKPIIMDHSWNSSYVYGVDNESGWGGRFFFTYYSEFDDKPAAFVALEITVFAVIFVVSVVANASIIICVSRYPDMKTVTNCFVLNLAAADLLFAFTIPAVAYTRVAVSWEMGDLACRIIPYIQFVSGIVLLWTLALISIDRHRCIVVPPYRSKMTPIQASLSSLVIWTSTIIIFIPVTIWFRQVASENNLLVCTLIFPKSNTIQYSILFVIPVVLFACLLPMCLLVYHYQKIFQKILSTKNTWATSCVMISAVDIKGCNRAQIRRQSELSLSDIFVPWPRKFSAQFTSSPNRNVGRQGSLSHHEEIRLNKHIKVVRVLFLNVVVVLVMWLPITLIMILIYIDGRRDNEDKNYFLRSRHFIIALTVALLNTVVNPLLYGVLSDSFRSCLMRIWCCRKNKLEVILPEPVTPSSGRQNGVLKQPKKHSIANSLSEKSEHHNQNDAV